MAEREQAMEQALEQLLAEMGEEMPIELEEEDARDLWGDLEKEGETKKGRRYIRWTFTEDLETDQTSKVMDKLSLNAGTAFFIRYGYSQILENIETEETMIYYTNSPGSPWMRTLAAAKTWLEIEEEARLEIRGGGGPSTIWKKKAFHKVTVKIVLDRNTPLLGKGRLPAWLKNLAHGRQMVTLDTYEDNYCLWRCIAVHQGARPDRCEREAKSLAAQFFSSPTSNNVPKTALKDLDKVERFLNKGKPVTEWLGIRVYEPERQEDEQVNWVLVRKAPAKLKNSMTLGYYSEHAFLIKNIDKLASVFECKDCQQKFTQAVSLSRHGKTCGQGKTKVWCQEGKVEKPRTAYEKAFYPKSVVSKASILWLEKVGEQRRRHIHHALCGHGGERWILGAPVDGYDPGEKTIYQFHGCYWHGCRKCHPTNRDRLTGDKTLEESYEATKDRTLKLRSAGYRVYEAWSCEAGKLEGSAPPEETRTYPHAIFFDFEAYVAKGSKRK